ncbi:hypothetical protein ACHAWF_000838 [Thalassiosira exigua]
MSSWLEENHEQEISLFHRGAAVCAIQTGGLKYLDEWVDYNFALGFEKIFIYDNSNDFELREWQRGGHDRANQIKIKHFPGKALQLKAYDECGRAIQQSRSFSWIAFIDIDEFIVIHNTTKYPTIMDLLETVPDHAGGLAINWREFVSDYNSTYEPKPLTFRCQNRHPRTNKHVKTIQRTKFFEEAVNPHFNLHNEPDIYTVDSSGNEVEGPFNERGTSDKVNINHYYSKSLEEFKSRCARGRADVTDLSDYLPCKSDEEIRRAIFDGERVFDDSAWMFLKDRVPKYKQYEALS